MPEEPKNSAANMATQPEIEPVLPLNGRCWLVSNLKYPPYKRCQYCELEFRKCLFLQYQIITLILVCFSFVLIFISDRQISPSTIMSIFLIVIVYGYYFNNSTEKIIKSNYYEKQVKNELKELSEKLEDKVREQTKDIREQNAHLEELLSMKSDFLRTVNHQLNTPLTIMKNAFSMIKDKSLPMEKGLEIAGHGLERMNSTIEDFWSAFELEEQDRPSEIKETDIEKIVKELVQEKKKLEITITRKLKIRYIKPDFVVPKVLCVEKKIPHVISNLLDNAVYYTQKGTIKIWFEKEQKENTEYLKTCISDTGEGISDEDKDKIFEKFYRGEITSSINPNGSGLGLYIAKNIVEDSNGELKLEHSEIGKGSTFSFSLPIAKAARSGKAGSWPVPGKG